MFTGIIEEIGTVADVREDRGGRIFTLACRTVLEGMKLGDSIAVDGVCLTATAIRPEGFTVEAVGTTLGRTTLGELTRGRRVNLERALALGARLGGHIVQGHVDGVGRVVAVSHAGDARLVDVAVDERIAELLVPQGSITVDGVSLTVNDLPAESVVQLSLIEYTLRHTALEALAAGDRVHLEADVVGKYVQRLLEPYLAREGRAGLSGAAAAAR